MPAPRWAEAASRTRPLVCRRSRTHTPNPPFPHPSAVAVGRAPSSFSHPSANERALGPLGLAVSVYNLS